MLIPGTTVRPFRFECTACGKCCRHQHGGTSILLEDAERLAAFLEIPLGTFLAVYCTFRYRRVSQGDSEFTVPDLRLRDRDGECVFLVGKLCSVHEAKPWVCRAAPFVSEIFLDPEAERLLVEICDGYGQGPVHSEAEIRGWLEEELDKERVDRHRYRSGAATRLGLEGRASAGLRDGAVASPIGSPPQPDPEV